MADKILCPAFYSLSLDADFESADMGRAFEIAVGCELVRFPGSLSYWRERNHEVDYIYSFGKKLFALEIKSGRKKSAKGLSRFLQEFPRSEGIIVTPDNFEKVLVELARAVE